MPDEPYSFAALRNRLTVEGDLVALTALRVGAGRASDVLANDLPVLRDALGAPFLPGASLKGALRAQLEALIRAIAPGQAPDLLQIEDTMRTRVAELREKVYLARLRAGSDAAEADRLFSERIWSEVSGAIDLTFGAPWLAGRLAVSDAPVDRELWFGQFEVRNGVALNRDTETAEEGLLYDYEVVPAGTRFSFALTLENAQPWQLGMVCAALQPWHEGRVQIGGFRTRGLGFVRLEGASYSYSEIGGPDDVLRMLCSPETLAGLGIAPPEAGIPRDTLGGWFEAFHDELHRWALAQG